MGWEDLLAPVGAAAERALPWVGGRKITDGHRTWTLEGRRPVEHGWYSFLTTGGRKASLVGPVDPDPDFEVGKSLIKGYLVGDRLIPDGARVVSDPDKFVEQTKTVHLVDLGLAHFTRAVATQVGNNLIFLRVEFPLGPEEEVLAAYQDRKDTLDGIFGVTPALDLAFRFTSRQRLVGEQRRAEAIRLAAEREARLAAEARLAEARLAAEARMAEAVKNMGTGAGRRHLAQYDFEAAARAALSLSGSELLDCRPEYGEREHMVVTYRFRGRRLECVVNKQTLRIVDAGVCLDDHRGEKGDTYFTLESLPGVVGEAMDIGALVVWRGDRW